MGSNLTSSVLTYSFFFLSTQKAGGQTCHAQHEFKVLVTDFGRLVACFGFYCPLRLF